MEFIDEIIKNKPVFLLLIVSLSLFSFSFFYDSFTPQAIQDEIPEYVDYQEPTEKIPLYYNIDDPSIIYTKNKSGDFEEIEING